MFFIYFEISSDQSYFIRIHSIQKQLYNKSRKNITKLLLLSYNYNGILYNIRICFVEGIIRKCFAKLKIAEQSTKKSKLINITIIHKVINYLLL